MRLRSSTAIKSPQEVLKKKTATKTNKFYRHFSYFINSRPQNFSTAERNLFRILKRFFCSQKPKLVRQIYTKGSFLSSYRLSLVFAFGIPWTENKRPKPKILSRCLRRFASIVLCLFAYREKVTQTKQKSAVLRCTWLKFELGIIICNHSRLSNRLRSRGCQTIDFCLLLIWRGIKFPNEFERKIWANFAGRKLSKMWPTPNTFLGSWFWEPILLGLVLGVQIWVVVTFANNWLKFLQKMRVLLQMGKGTDLF